MFSRTLDGTMAIDSSLRIVAWNAAAGQLLGFSAEEALGRCCADLLHWHDRHGNLVCSRDCPIAELAACDLLTGSRDVLAITKSNHRIWLNVSTLYVPPEFQHVCLAVHFFRELMITPEQRDVQEMPEPSGPRVETTRLLALTGREREVLDLLAEGLSGSQIADRLVISSATVRNHLQRILSKLGVHSRLEAIFFLLHTRS